MKPEFGAFARQLRVNLGETLREFCMRSDLDAAYISRIERGLLSPPQDAVKLAHYAESLRIRSGSEEWQKFMDLAAIAAGKLPPDLRNNEQLMACLPSFLRTVRGQKIDDKDLDRLIEMIREGGKKR